MKNNESFFELFKFIINVIIDKYIFLREILITNYLGILSLIISKLKEKNINKIIEYDFSELLILLMNHYLINTTNNLNKNYSKYNDKEYIGILFELIGNIISINPIKYVIDFFLK